ncbi:OsmC family protein [Gelidibacter japonicus]|uniref:OsmC family protein n=1 Tax=Gelidibacter japonicus TaxID=1962232 RepID=UPI002AFE6DC9|nr:OsmC family protein [Gelidibacter japonicus]
MSPKMNTNGEKIKEFKEILNPKENSFAEYTVTGSWKDNMTIDVQTHDIMFADKVIKHQHLFKVDEPEELLGTGTAPTAQDYLMAGLAGSMLTTFATEASVRGVSISSLCLEIKGKLDLKAIHGIKRKVNPGFEKLEYRFVVESKASSTTIYEIANHVIFYSPIYATISKGETEIVRRVEIVC